MRRGSLLLAAALLLPACPSQDDPPAGGRARVPLPKTAPGTATTRPKLDLPPPVAPPPKPDGQPQNPGDLRKLADSAAAGTPVERPGAPEITVLDEHRRRIGKTLVDRQARRIEVPAQVNQTAGILEYYACGTGGKLHESVLETLDKGSHLHLALLLLGLNADEYVNDERIGQRRVRNGDTVRIFVEWQDPADKKRKRVPAEAWLYNRRRKAAPPAGDWHFVGSAFWNGDYSADNGKSIIGLIPDPTVVVGLHDDEGNPYRGPMLGFEVNTKVIPPKGTPVTLVLESAGHP